MHWSSLNPRTWFASRTQSAVPDELAAHLLLGQRGERLAAEYLERLGYRLVVSNFTLPVGRNRRGAIVQAEIDLIAYDAETLCFIEIKTRSSDWFAAPSVNVDLRKQRQIARVARAYRRMFDLVDEPYRYDVVSVILPPENDSGKMAPPRVEVLRNFWRDDKFHKRRWTESFGDY